MIPSQVNKLCFFVRISSSESDHVMTSKKKYLNRMSVNNTGKFLVDRSNY